MLFTFAAAALTLFSAVQALPTEAAPLALGRAVVQNKCGHPVYLWSVGGSIGGKNKILSGGTFSQVYRNDASSGGIALKVTTVDDGLFKENVPQTVFSYTLDKEKIWYDLNDVSGDAFSGKMVTLRPGLSSCPADTWQTGKPPGGTQIKECTSNVDVVLTLCA